MIMGMQQQDILGSIVAVWRYPVKSMMGEELNASDVTERGLLGDRGYALIDAETGKVASTKNPRRWGRLFECRSAYIEPPSDPASFPPARISLPDGSLVLTSDSGVANRLGQVVGRTVRLASSAPEGAAIEGYWPEYDFLPNPDKVFDVTLPAGTFFDDAPVHLVTTATLDRLRELAPRSRFEARRFRPNFVVEMANGAQGFVENDWAGRNLRIGDEVVLHIGRPCPRCVMTTLPQGDLPKDPGVLRAVVQNNEGNVGVLASVVRPGRVRRGDAIAVE
jgi:uncharacterized protein YcbX